MSDALPLDLTPCRLQERERIIAQSWSNQVVTSERWQLQRLVDVGSTNPWFVIGRTHRAVAKRAYLQGFGRTIPVGAHEKIAADLAYEIGVCVAPVMLWINREDEMQTWTISAFPYRQPLSPRDLDPETRSKVLCSARRSVARAFVFHTWIGDTDHHGSDENWLTSADFDPDDAAVTFVDHGLSMTLEWPSGSATPDNRLTDYYLQRRELPEDEIKLILNKILALSEQDVTKLVQRIPDRYLSAEEAAIICDGLLERRQRLPRLLEL